MEFNLSSNALSLSTEGKSELAKMTTSDSWVQVNEIFESVISISEDGGFGIDSEEFLTPMNAILSSQSTTFKNERIKIVEEIVEIDENANRALQFEFILTSIIFIAIAAVTWFITRGIKQGVSSVSKAVTAMAQGDLDHLIEIKGSDEIAAVSQATNDTILQLKEVFKSNRVDWDHMSKMEELEKQARVAQKEAENAAEKADVEKKAAESAKQEAEKAKENAVKAQEEVEKALKMAELEKEKALESQASAEQAKLASQEAARVAEKEKQKAEGETQKAIRASAEASEAKKNAESAAFVAKQEKDKAQIAMEESQKAQKVAETEKAKSEVAMREAEQAARLAETEKEKATKLKTESEKAKAEAEQLGQKARNEAEVLRKRAEVVLQAVSSGREWRSYRYD